MQEEKDDEEAVERAAKRLKKAEAENPDKPEKYLMPDSFTSGVSKAGQETKNQIKLLRDGFLLFF